MEVIKGDSPLLGTAKWSAAAPSGAIAALVTGFLLGRWCHHVLCYGLLYNRSMHLRHCTRAANLLGTSFCREPDYILGNVCVPSSHSTVPSCVICLRDDDMSFPSSTLILSNAMHRHHQGLAASLLATTVNYSITFGLPFAGTVESHVNDAGRNVLRGYRGALYMGIGLAGLDLITSIWFMWVSWRRHRAAKND